MIVTVAAHESVLLPAGLVQEFLSMCSSGAAAYAQAPRYQDADGEVYVVMSGDWEDWQVAATQNPAILASLDQPEDMATEEWQAVLSMLTQAQAVYDICVVTYDENGQLEVDPTPQPGRIMAVVGVDGLAALNLMNLLREED